MALLSCVSFLKIAPYGRGSVKALQSVLSRDQRERSGS